MDDSPAYPEPDGDDAGETRPQPARRSPPRTPGWVLVLGILALVLILAVAVQIVFGIRHGPGLHGMSTDATAGLLVHLW